MATITKVGADQLSVISILSVLFVAYRWDSIGGLHTSLTVTGTRRWGSSI